MEKYTYVFGHTNPDTDSICASISYAHLKRALGYTETRAARLGKVNKETQYALDYFQVEAPRYLSNIQPQVADMDYYKIPPLYAEDSVKKAWDILTEERKQVVPILYSDHKLAGVISLSDIAKMYIGLTDGSVLRTHHTPFVNIPAVLEGRVISGEYPEPYVEGEVYTTASIRKEDNLNDRDILITGDNKELIEKALNSGAGCVIITDQDLELDTIEIPKDCKCAVISTACSFFKTIKLISQSIAIKDLIGNQNVIYFNLEDGMDEVKEIMLTTTHRNFPIVNSKGEVQGMITKRHLLNLKKKKVILVDHNEKGQTVQGLDQAKILEIIDHHRIANIDTQSPVFLRAEPVGCTCTIIGKMYQENNIMPPREIAGLILSAILSDTLMFQSPTCTEDDIKVAKRMAKIAEVDWESYGMNLIAAGTALEGMSPADLIYMDKKSFALGKYQVSVSQINTGDFKSVYKMIDSILEEMNGLNEREHLDLSVLMVTDIIMGGTELIAVGSEKWLAEQAFGIRKEETSIFLPKVFSRKKQVIPKLMTATQNK